VSVEETRPHVAKGPRSGRSHRRSVEPALGEPPDSLADYDMATVDLRF
jgi:hypothetical protein